MKLGAFLLSILSGIVLKVAVLALTVWLLLALHRACAGRGALSVAPEHRPALRLLWWSLVCFCIAELFCGLEAWMIFRTDALASGVHATASGVGMGLCGLALYLLIDAKLLRFGAKRCIANRICRGCTIDQPEGCRFRWVLVSVAVFLVLAALLPLLVATDPVPADASRYVLPFDSLNAWYDEAYLPWLREHFGDFDPSGSDHVLLESTLTIELRVLPLVGLALSLVGGLMVGSGRERGGLKVLAAAAGVIGYSYLELVAYVAIGEAILGSVAHEAVELWFLVALAFFLRVAFRPPEETDAQPSFWRRRGPLLFDLALSAYFLAVFGIQTYALWAAGQLGFVEVSFTVQNLVMVTFILLRRRHRKLDHNLLHQVVALVAFFSGAALIGQPGSGGPVAQTVSDVVTLAANLLLVACLFNLGRSFGILVALRDIKTKGLYRLVRHPMYAADVLLRVGFIISHLSWFSVAVVIVSSACYVYRAIIEERFLLRESEDYRRYLEAVRYRFVPGLF